jgi:uncharacterized hydrophobic protein (TIGR00271 family)
MPTVTTTDIDRMTSALYIDGPVRSRASSRFWILLVLAAVIATAGVIGDSTATVIGAMIVAPLMTPILGAALAVVLADRAHVMRSVLLILGGALAVIAIALVMGFLGAPLDDFATNGQVSARIHPKIIDLVAALATGTVGAFALVRSDISDTLPGVAIAISLVPPLAVVGLLLSVGRFEDAAGAALLFGTNVAAIIATGAAVLLAYRIRDAAKESAAVVGQLRGRALVVVGALVLLVSVPLAVGTWNAAQDELIASKAEPLAEAWASQNDWLVSGLRVQYGEVIITALGAPPNADPAELRAAMNENGLESSDLTVRLVLGGAAECPRGGTTCTRSDE